MSTNIELLQSAARRAAEDAVKNFSEINQSTVVRPLPFLAVTIPLDTAATEESPWQLPAFPFRGIWVSDATDTEVSVNLILHSREKQHTMYPLPIKKNFNAEFPYLIGQAYLTFDAQADKTINLILIKEGKIDPGFEISDTSGGVSITTGDSATQETDFALTNVATEILAAAATRKQALLYNHGPDRAWLGGAGLDGTIGSKSGIPVDVGASFQWDSQAALRGLSEGTSTLSILKLS